MVGSKNRFAQEIVEAKFFNNLNSIDDLIKKISKGYNFNNRGIQLTKGDIFEIFCEAYLSTNPEYQVKEVYPQGYVPVKIRKKLKLSFQDKGYDGVYRTTDGNLHTYQAKFRTKSDKLNWAQDYKGGLSSFIGVSEQAHIRHLLATTNKVDSEFLSKPRIQLTLLNDLKKLSKIDFEKINSFLNKKKIQHKKHKPERYQELAINNVLNEFKSSDRTTIIMACGTGKTEVGLWIYEKRRPRTALVLVPSIALVKQIRGSWLSQLDHKIATYQLCSSKDVTKQEDHIQVRKTDLDMQFYSDVNDLKKWLKKNEHNKKIIFSTYQSSKLLKGVFNKKKPIDFAVFDEAHRTAVLNSKIDSYFSFALHNKNIPIKKRLFMTATRRISSQTKSTKVGDNVLNISMDNEKIYGNVCYNLSFYEAARKYNAIAKPRIIISEVSSEEVSEENRRFSATHLKGLKLKTDYLALIIAIRKAIKKYNIKKIFSFHKTVNDSKIFADPNKPESINSYLKDFYTNFVSGNMSMRKRDEIMDEFISSSKGLISNARCLVEGVNVPSVDMISFTHQKESEVDIVQAIGRALRNRNQKKKFGYVLVPLFVEKNKNETFEKALDRTNFKKVIILLKALREHDTEIAQIMEEILINEGRGKGFSLRNRKKISDLIETVNPEIKKKILVKSIHSKVIDDLRLKWDLMIGKLLDYKKVYGTTNVEHGKKDFLDLRQWVTEVRRGFRSNKLYNFQIEQLKKYQFNFNEPGVTTFDKSKFYSLQQISEKFNLSGLKIIRFLKKNLKPLEVYFGSSGKVNLYKKYSKHELAKIIGINFFIKDKPYVKTKANLAALIKKDVSVIDRLIKMKKIRPLGKTYLPDGGITPVFKDYSKKDLMKIIGIDSFETKGLVTKEMMIKQIFKKKGSTEYGNGIIENLIKQKKIKPVLKSYGPSGVSLFYKKVSKKQITKLTGINVFDIKDYVSRTQFLKNIFGKRKHDEYFIFCENKKQIKPIGIGVAAGGGGVCKVYKQLTKKQFFALNKIDFVGEDKFYVNLSQFSRIYKKDRGVIKRMDKLNLFKDFKRGWGHGQSDVRKFYRKITFNEFNNLHLKYKNLI